MKNIVTYFIPPNVPDNAESQRKAKLTVWVLIIIALFNINYNIISFFIHFPGGNISQLPLLPITILCLFLYKFKVNPAIIFPFYFACCSAAIGLVIYYTGGFISVLFPWLAPIALIAVMVWNKKGSSFLMLFILIIEIFLFILYAANFPVSNQIKPKYQHFFYLTTNIGLSLIIFWIAIVFENAKDMALNKLNNALSALKIEKNRSDELLLNILPLEVAEELKEKGKAAAHRFDNVSILFTDFVNFTGTAEKLTPEQLVTELHECFTAFDHITERNGMEKIKTVGDAYLAVCGLPQAITDHARRTVQSAKEIQTFMEERSRNEKTFGIRIGVHSGSVVAGIVGVKKFAYDIWGDAVNTAARMEQNSEVGKVNISEKTFEIVKNDFICAFRGEIEAKNKGKMKMYFVEGKG